MNVCVNVGGLPNLGMLTALLPQEAPAALVASPAHVRPKCAAACHGVLCADGLIAASNDACECVCNDELLLAGASVPQLLSVAPLRKLARGADTAQCQNLLETYGASRDVPQWLRTESSEAEGTAKGRRRHSSRRSSAHELEVART